MPRSTHGSATLTGPTGRHHISIIFYMSSTGRKEETTARWGNPDRLKFYALIEKKVINLNDPRHNTPSYIDNIRLHHWPGKNTLTFRDNYRTTLATHLTNSSVQGKRAPAGKLALYLSCNTNPTLTSLNPCCMHSRRCLH